MNHHRIVSTVITLLLTAGAASAQEKGQVGLAMGTPSTIAFVWHPSDSIGVRPEVNFARTSSESDNSSSFGSKGHAGNVSFGVSGLFYFHKLDSLHPYVTPRFTDTRTTAKTDSTSNVNPLTSKLTADTYAIAGSIGAQYAVTKRFGVFGETGLTYSHQTQKQGTTIATTTGTSDTFGNRSAVGVVLYF